jgi:mono/diheme cytochrome c family protein
MSRIRTALLPLAVVTLAFVGAGLAAQGMPKPITLVDRPNATGGEKLYVEHCAMCHAPNGMGYGLLARRLKQPDLEKRDNLTAQVVIAFARSGIGNMPPITRGEVSDAELKQIADYLAAGPHPSSSGAAK